MSLNTTPRTWVSGAILTAAQLNTEVRDAFTGVQSAWTSFTPTLTGITLGNGTLACAYLQIGKTVRARCLFNAGSTTTYSAASLAFSLPVTPHADYSPGNFAVGSAVVQPGAGATRYPAITFINASSTLNFLVATGAANAVATNLVPSTFGTSANISWTVEYEAA